ncbi:MAG: DEAD/DEAH box helicase [Bacteroidetes bacterium]|nr:DEAD/DEAH box helicase [Bacteroidota bacterium]MCW5894249.1 DEAD/DEAH box helicase [Bacteroidota bacterium]
MYSPLNDFHPTVRRWFEKTFGEPSPPQVQGWPSISSGKHTLILAPTGSGKTLAAFLWAINHLVEQHLAKELPPGVRILYVSPLKALNNDIQRNLELPLEGIRQEAEADGLKLPAITTAVRTGDTPQHRRSAMIRKPPDILITTPESLYLMLTSKQARKIFTTVQYVIVDEIHSVCNNKRGVHLSLTLERLQQVAQQDFVRIGLSATQRPLEDIAAFLGGQMWNGSEMLPRPVNIVDAGQKKQMDLMVECAPPDFSDLPAESVWPMVFTEILQLILLHKTTLIFVNNRRLAERVAAKLNEMLTGENNEGASAGRAFNMYAVPMALPNPKSQVPSSNQFAIGNSQSATPPIDNPQSEIRNPQSVIPRNDLVQAYHGSMSRTAREQMEAELKAGNLRCLVATSSLELGIDIGSIDLVIQLQSPKGVARGLQRVGRSGHVIAATSKGRIFPTFREDLVESAVVSHAMMQHDVEFTNIPKDCLDVLAQQIVAMVSVEEWHVDELFSLIKQSYCYRDLSGKLYSGVLNMLAGRYTNEMFRELRARISWDKVNNTLRALPGSSQLAITSGGTIADRGYFGVYLEDGKTKVGEVDEEFVYESRAGDTFILGSSVWRMLEIDANRITVAPAPGMPARMPFWRGEGIGRSFELSIKVADFRKEMSHRVDSPDCLKWLQTEFPVDSKAAWNIEQYFLKQKNITGVVPHSELLVIEGFRDEVGDPRIVIHSSFGRRVNGLLGLLFSRRLQQLIGTEPQMLYNDDGILLRCPDVDELPLNLADNLTLSEAEDIVLTDLLSSPLFGGQFRMNAARALLMPKIAPGKRTPLWLQRLRAKDLLQIARQFNDFPIVIETIRDVLNDVLDFEHFKEIVQKIVVGRIRVESVHTEVPSPFAASLLFDFIQVYMYEWDEPKTDRMSRYLEVNRELLSEVVDLDSMSEMLRPEAIETVERQLQHAAEGYKARSPEELLEILLRVGDLSEEEIKERIVEGDLSMLYELEKNGRAIRMNFPSGTRWIAGEEDDLYSYSDSEQNQTAIIRRYLQSHGPVSSQELTARYGFKHENVSDLLTKLATAKEIIEGKFKAAGQSSGMQFVYRTNLERIHRQTITILRKEIQPSSIAEFTNFLLHWQKLHPSTQEIGAEGVQNVLEQFQALPLPAEAWEREILFRRVKNYSRESLASLTSAGTIVWTGGGPGKLKCIVRGEGSAFLEQLSPEFEAGLAEASRRILTYIRANGASFLHDIRSGTHLSLDAINNGIAELFWNGLVTNDVFAELLAVKRFAKPGEEKPLEPIDLVTGRRNPYRFKAMQSVRRALKQVPGWSGRWSLVHLPGVLGAELTLEEKAEAQAVLLLNRYGILAREFYKREELLPWGMIAAQLQRMEMRGEIRRGYFVEGLSGMQYALPAAVESLRRMRAGVAGDEEAILVNACDPANPAGVGGFSIEPQPSRIPSNYIAFHRGTPVLVIEGNGARLHTIGEPATGVVTSALKQFISLIKLPDGLRPFKEIVVEHCNSERPAASPLAPLLASLGFRRDVNQTMRYDGYA